MALCLSQHVDRDVDVVLVRAVVCMAPQWGLHWARSQRAGVSRAQFFKVTVRNITGASATLGYRLPLLLAEAPCSDPKACCRHIWHAPPRHGMGSHRLIIRAVRHACSCAGVGLCLALARVRVMPCSALPAATGAGSVAFVTRCLFCEPTVSGLTLTQALTQP